MQYNRELLISPIANLKGLGPKASSDTWVQTNLTKNAYFQIDNSQSCPHGNTPNISVS